MNKMLFSLFLVFTGLASGYIIQKLVSLSKITLKSSIKDIRRAMQTAVLSVLIPVTVVGSIWIAPLKHIEILSLPLLGAFAILFGGTLAYIFAGPLGLNREQRGVYAVSGGFTNMGSLGGLITFILLGEAGFALLAIYQVFEKFVYFMIGFPLAKSHSSHHREGKSVKSFLSDAVKDPVIAINMVALLLGAALNLAGVERPEYFKTLNQVLVPLGSFVLLISIGLAMQFGPMKKYVYPGLLIIAVKSILVPAATFTLGFLLGLGNIEGGLALKFLIVLSAMPVGFMSLVPPTLYDMDLDLANTSWFFSTMSLIVVVPVLSFIIPYIG